MDNLIPSPTMQQFPLSPRKFWKKVIDKGLLFFILMGLGFIVLLIFTFVSSKDRGSIFGLGVAILAGLTAVFVLLVELPYSLYIRAYIRRYYYDCSDNFITIRKGVFAPTEIHVQYQKIQDVYVDQDILDRIFGIYDVHIASATVSSGIASHIDGVEKQQAEAIKQMLLEKVQGYGHGPSAPQAAALSAVPQPVAPTPITNAKYANVSEQAYPISGAWYVSKVLGNVVGVGLIILIIWANVTDKEGVHVEGFIWPGIWMVSLIGHMIGLVIWKSNFKFSFGPEYITLKQGILSREERHVPYKTIQDVRISQSFIERMLGISTVIIENATTSGPAMNFGTRNSGVFTNGITIPGQPLAKGQELVSIINDITRNTVSSSTGL